MSLGQDLNVFLVSYFADRVLSILSENWSVPYNNYVS